MNLDGVKPTIYIADIGIEATPLMTTAPSLFSLPSHVNINRDDNNCGGKAFNFQMRSLGYPHLSTTSLDSTPATLSLASFLSASFFLPVVPWLIPVAVVQVPWAPKISSNPTASWTAPTILNQFYMSSVTTRTPWNALRGIP